VPGATDQLRSPATTRLQVHGTTVGLHVCGRGGPREAVAALIRGPSGAGKSDLALRCLAQPPLPNTLIGGDVGSAQLVADDRTDLVVTNGVWMASCPSTIAGLIEVRGLGIVAVPYFATARLVLVVDLVESRQVARLPTYEATQLMQPMLSPMLAPLLTGRTPHVADLPRLAIVPFEASSPLKLLLALVRTAFTGSPVGANAGANAGADAAIHHHLPEGQ
jgi:HPr kinase/phosphorylase